MDKETEKLIIKSTLCSVEIGILNYLIEGKPINGQSMSEILKDIENKVDKIYRTDEAKSN